MTTIVTRVGKGSPLTWTEVDSNFTNLNNAKYESGNNASFGTISGTTITASSGFSGALNGTVGATTPASGAFTALSASSTVSGTGFSTYLASPPAIGGTTPAAGTFTSGSFTSLTDSGNLTFTGTANRITGDFSNATLANRVLFQSSTTNGSTQLSAIPNGTGTQSGFFFYDTSDTTNNAFGAIRTVATTDVRLQSGITGTGSYLPMTFYTGGSEAMRIDTSGNVGIGVSPAVRLDVQASSNQLRVSTGAANSFYGLDAGAGVCTWKDFTDASEAISLNNAGYINFTTASSERMRIDSSGNVGIGAASNGAKFYVQQNQAAYSYFDFENSTNGGGIVWRQITRNIANTGTTSVDLARLIGGGLAINNNDTNSANFTSFGVGASERMRIDSSGNVGIGTSSPSARLDVRTAAGTAAIQNIYTGSNAAAATLQFGQIGAIAWDLGITSTNGYFQIGINGGGLGYNINRAGTVIDYHSWLTNGSERMRIDSSGTVFMGQTTNPATATLVLKVPTGTANGVNAQITSNTGTSYPWSNYNATGTYVGGISCTSSATAFPTSSDVRLKKNIENAPSAIDKVLNAQVVSHDWINDDAHVEYGFIAQDLQKVIPQAVIEGTDKEDGTIDMPWGVDYSKIVPLLTKAIQELKAELDTVKAELNTLKGN